MIAICFCKNYTRTVARIHRLNASSMVKHIVGVAQTCSQQFDITKTISKISQLTVEARSQNVTLLVFPEATIGGYPKHSTFDTNVGLRTNRGREMCRKYHAGAIAIPSDTIDSLSNLAIENAVSLVIGIIEKDGSTLYCTAIYIDSTHGYVGKHRKLIPTAAERIMWAQGDASTLTVPKLSLHDTQVSTSAAICWENYMPLLRMHYYQQGVEIYCAPTVDARESWLHTMQHIAAEGRCFVLSACQYARKEDFPDWMQAEISDDEVIAGGSCIISPMGELLAGQLRGSEGILIAEFDLDDITRSRFDMDVTGHYSRSDVFDFKVKS